MRPSDFIRKITTEWRMLLRSLRPSRATTRTRPSASSQPPSEPLLSAPSVVRYEWQKYANVPFQAPPVVPGTTWLEGMTADLRGQGIPIIEVAGPYDWAMDEPVTLGELAAELRGQGIPIIELSKTDNHWSHWDAEQRAADEAFLKGLSEC